MAGTLAHKVKHKMFYLQVQIYYIKLLAKPRIGFSVQEEICEKPEFTLVNHVTPTANQVGSLSST
jgi:hypothetical protein